MYTKIVFGAILAATTLFAPLVTRAQPAAPPSEAAPEAPPKATQPPPADNNEASPDQAEEKGFAAAGQSQPPVPWGDEIARLAAGRPPKGVDDLRRLQEQVQAVVAHARPATVAVQVGDAIGSGVIVNAEGLILTAGHVAVKPNIPVRVLFQDGRRVRGVTLGLNESIDSGMMKITDEGPWPHVKVGRAGKLSLGEWVITLGQPNGFYLGRKPPVRLGRVLFQDDEVINTDCTLVGGDSGGPLLNLRGEVVGIHSRIGSRITSNFHVPISTYELTWDRLLAGEAWGGGIGGNERARYRPALGIKCNPGESPCRVVQVMRGMPAERAGIRRGDVISAVDGTQVESLADISRLVLDKKPGDKVKVSLDREGESLELTLALGQLPRDFPGLPRGEP